MHSFRYLSQWSYKKEIECMEELLNLSLLRTGGLDIKLSDEYEKSPVSSEQVAVFKYDKNQSNKASL